MKFADAWWKFSDYIIARFSENSTYRGLLMCVSAASGWATTKQIDLSSPQLLEAATWGGMFIIGLINIFRKVK